ncbi:MAG: hypothetical protein M3Y53_04355 [Thermoproteota archaeon]|nr:hypothetical protein [Thermoproteota archaeon]
MTVLPEDEPANDAGFGLLPETVIVKSDGFLLPPDTFVVTLRVPNNPGGGVGMGLEFQEAGLAMGQAQEEYSGSGLEWSLQHSYRSSLNLRILEERE